MKFSSLALLLFLFCGITYSIVNSVLSEPQSAKKVLLSVDSTWFHRLGLNRFTYKRALRRVGLQPVTVDYLALNDAIPDALLAQRLLSGKHGLVLAGGGDVDPSLFGQPTEFSLGVNSQRDRFELALLREAEKLGIPVFAICRGVQLLNVARGGSLRNLRHDSALAKYHKRRLGGHAVQLVADSRLAQWMGSSNIKRVTSYHGQAIDRLGEGLRVVGFSDDGVVEAVESTREAGREGVFGTIGVQWHPEVKTGADQVRIFAAFAEAVKYSVDAPVAIKVD